MLFVYGMTVIIISSWAVRMVLEKKLIIRSTPLDIPIFLFLASQVLSTLFSIHPRTSFFGYYTRFNGGLFSTFTYIALFYAFVANVKKRHLPGIFMTFLVSSVLVSLYAIPEHFGHSASCALITGEYGVDCWKQKVQERIFGTFGQPNWLAAYAITLTPLILALSTTAKQTFSSIKKNIPFLSVKWLKVIATIASISLFATLIFTQSRSGLLGLIVGLGVFFVGLFFIQWQNSPSSSIILTPIKKLKFELIGFIILTLFFGTVLTPSIKNKLTSLQKTTSEQSSASDTASDTPPVIAPRTDMGGTESGDIRKIVWSGAIDVWRRYPVLGSGVETFAYSYYQDRPVEHNLVSEWDFLYNKAHNEFLNILATTGAVGLITYLLFLGSYGFLSIKFIIKKQSTKDQLRQSQSNANKILVLSLLSGIIAMTVSNFFGFSTVMTQLLLFIFIAIFIVVSTEKNKYSKNEKKNITKKTSKKTKDSIHFTAYILVPIIIITAIFFLASIYRIWKADWHYAQGKALISANQSIEGVNHLQEAILISPQEALFYDDLSHAYASLAVGYSESDATTSAELAQAAILTSDYTQQLNNRHLNFYKTRARVYITLAQLNPDYLTDAHNTLLNALEYSPNDAKIMYNLALIEASLHNNNSDNLDEHNETLSTKAISTLEKSIEIKPNYPAARFELGKMYENAGEIDKAREQYVYILDVLGVPSEETQLRLNELTE